MAKQRASPAAAIRRIIGGRWLLRWAARVTVSVVAWTLLFHLFSFLGINRSPLHVTRPSCLDARNNSTAASAAASVVTTGEVGHLAPLPRIVLFSDFGDIFDVHHFIDSLRDEVKIIKELPHKFRGKVPLSMQPISWSSEKYYLRQILPLVRKHKVIRFSKTDTRLANNGLPLKLQKLRCRVNYNALRFAPFIEDLGNKMISILRKSGSFVVLHLRYEMDMLAFSGCTHGCSDEEIEDLTRMRYSYPWWKEKEIDSEKKRLEGLCPLTPGETTLVLKALGFPRDTRIYIASGEIYGGEKRLAALKAEFPNIVRKEMLLSDDELRLFQKHSTQMAALDYLVSVTSDVFIPSNDGNMAKVVEGHRRFTGFHRTIQLDRKKLVELIDLFEDQELSWDEFSVAVKELHWGRMSQPAKRRVIPGQPKEEDYFYANPHECLGPAVKRRERLKHTEI